MKAAILYIYIYIYIYMYNDTYYVLSVLRNTAYWIAINKTAKDNITNTLIR